MTKNIIANFIKVLSILSNFLFIPLLVIWVWEFFHNQFHTGYCRLNDSTWCGLTPPYLHLFQKTIRMMKK
jgi:hypothetical protein